MLQQAGTLPREAVAEMSFLDIYLVVLFVALIALLVVKFKN